MKSFKTANGGELTIEDGKLTASVAGEKFQSDPHTAASEKEWIRTGKIRLFGKSRNAATIYTSELAAWIAENWPVVKTETEMWDDLMPESVRLHREWQDAFDASCKEIYSGRSVLRPAGPEPELDAEGSAWIELNDLELSANYDLAEIGRRYIREVLSGRMTLLEAAAAAKAERAENTQKHMWD